MSNPRFMPLYVADYLRDTMHLDAEASGAYLHLIMHYWVHDKLPDDPQQLARIARVSPQKWRHLAPVLEQFFGDGFSAHKRIDQELQRARTIMENRSERGRLAALKRWHKKHASGMQ